MKYANILCVTCLAVILTGCRASQFGDITCNTTPYIIHTPYEEQASLPKHTNEKCFVVQYTDAVVAITGWETYFPNTNMGKTVWHITPDGVLVNGILGQHTPIMIQALQNMPHKKVFILGDIEGSMDDDSNMIAGRMVYNLGYTTRVAPDGHVTSGGTDFFASGKHRQFYKTSKIGVHGWNDGDTDGHTVPKDDPTHTLYLDFYTHLGIDESFYWFTMQTPADDMYYMTRTEVEHYLNAKMLGE